MAALPPAAMAALAIGSAAVQAVGQISQGNAQASAANYNAQVSANEAVAARYRAAEEERRIRRDNQLRLGAAAARRGASGVAIEGSPLEVMADAAAEGELRALDSRYGGLMESRYHEQESAMFRAQARSARRNAAFGAVGTLVGAGLQYGSGLLGGAPTSSGLPRIGYTAGIRGGYGRLVGGV